jgi:hypothetical protein
MPWLKVVRLAGHIDALGGVVVVDDMNPDPMGR